MNVALDIDGTITKKPQFYAILARGVRAAGGKVFVVTSRSNSSDVRKQTKRELDAYGIAFDDLIIIADAEGDRIACPHDDLDWYQKYLWQKVSVCLKHKVSIVFEDDPKVIELFRRFAPSIQVFRAE